MQAVRRWRILQYALCAIHLRRVLRQQHASSTQRRMAWKRAPSSSSLCFQVVKQQMQIGLHRSTGDTVRSILRSDGVRGFYAGYLSTVIREIPFDALEFAIYEVRPGQAKPSQSEATGGHLLSPPPRSS